MFNLLADQILGLPLWAFIVIVVGVVLLIAIIVLAIVLAKKSKKNGGKEKTTETKSETSAQTKSVKEEKKDEKPKAASKSAETKQTKTAESKPAAKSTSKVYHISKRKEDGMWQIKAAGGEKAIKLFKTQKEAISYCKTLADNQDASIMIHKEDGSFRKLTY